MRSKTDKMYWRSERDRVGTYAALRDRLEFHGAVNIEEAAELMGVSIQTIRRHARKLQDERCAYISESGRIRYIAPEDQEMIRDALNRAN